MRSGAFSNNTTIRGVSPSGFRAKFDELLTSDGQAPIATISISKGAVVVKFFPHRDDTSFTTGIVEMMGEWKPRPKPEAYVDALFGQDLPVRMAWVDKESPNPEEETGR